MMGWAPSREPLDRFTQMRAVFVGLPRGFDRPHQEAVRVRRGESHCPTSKVRSSLSPMKLATFNINNINRRLPNLLQWLKAAKPDVVCLQELKCTDDAFPVEARAKAGYRSVWRGQRTWNGVAILSRGSEPRLAIASRCDRKKSCRRLPVRGSLKFRT